METMQPVAAPHGTTRPAPADSAWGCRGSHRHSQSSALAALTCALAIAACGTSGKSSGVGVSSGALEFAACMRSHGVSNFPDPNPNGGGVEIGPGSGINPESPAFQSAGRACGQLQGGTSQGSAASESDRLAAIANSRCMPAHGVPDFPDPTFPSRGGSSISLPPGINLQSPAFKQAQAACPWPPR